LQSNSEDNGRETEPTAMDWKTFLKEADWGAVWKGWKEWLLLLVGIAMVLGGLFALVWLLYAVFTGTADPEWFD
jgi:hypothetical protein